MRRNDPEFCRWVYTCNQCGERRYWHGREGEATFMLMMFKLDHQGHATLMAVDR